MIGSGDIISVEDIKESLPKKVLANWIEDYNKKNREKASLRFSHLKVEALINQASDILDRCLSLQREIDANWVQAARLYLELKADDADSESDSVELMGVEFAKGEAEEKSRSLEKSTPSSLYGNDPPWGGSPDATRDVILQNKIYNGILAGEGKSGAELGARYEARNASVLQRMDFCDERSAAGRALKHRADQEASIRKVKSSIKSYRQEKKNFAKDGPFDYLKRIENLVRYQLGPDLLDAHERCRVAAMGLKAVYGWKPESDKFLQEPPSANYEDLLNSTYVQELWSWANTAVRWLLRFSHHDQPFSVAASLTSWSEGSNKFSVASSISMSEMIYVRMRGISCMIGTKEGRPDALYEVRVRAPSEAEYATEAKEEPINIIQNLPWCWLGTVRSATSSAPPDVNGTVILHNASPLGQNDTPWELMVSPANDAARRSTITEINLILHLTGRPLLLASDR